MELKFIFNGTARLAAVDRFLCRPGGLIDTIKEKSKESVGRLKSLVIELIMFTGDNRRTAETFVGKKILGYGL